ncbi:MAG TPA: PRC-barrel domain-containing protein [Bryobacteraceae bacterium]|nr:PRC-barrel domain-containing protein [Bryobacteraceae bacterium]
MFFSADDLLDCKILARDDELGSVQDVYFDDQDWAARYLVVDTGGWLSGRRVLISPVASGPVDLESHRLPVHLNRAQIEESPPFDTVLPVSRQKEMEMTQYFGWPAYWGYGAPPGEAVPMAPVSAARASAGSAMAPESRAEPQLRSMREVTGYRIEAKNGQIGHVEDFLIEQETWKIRYLVVDTGALLPGKKVLLAPLWIDWIRWSERAVRADVGVEQIRSAPAFDNKTALTRDYELAVFEHYSRPRYWRDE